MLRLPEGMRGSDVRLRVAMVLDWFFYYAAPIANALADKADVLFVTRDSGNELGTCSPADERKRMVLDPRVRLVVIRGRQSEIRRSLEEMRAARAAIRAFRPDIVHEQLHCDWRLWSAARGMGAPHVLTVHDVTPHQKAQRHLNVVQHAMEQRILRGADTYIVHGRQQRTLVEAQPWHRTDAPIHVVPHGVLAQPAAPSPLPANPTLLFFGRIEHYKGLDILVKAVRLLRDSMSLRVIVAGRGAEVERCRTLAGNDPRFEWRTGFVRDEDLPGLFAESSVLVLPYREASQSGVIPLAFANRRAVIASTVGSLAEAIQEGQNGILVPPEDPAALANAILRAHADRSMLEALSDAALATVTSGAMSAEAVAARHLAIYRGLARETADRAEYGWPRRGRMRRALFEPVGADAVRPGLRVVFDIAALGQGGMERQLVSLIAGLRERGHHPLLVVNKSVTAYAEELRGGGVDVIQLGRRRRCDVRVVGDIARALRRHKADIVVGVGFNATLWSRLAATLAGCPAVTAEHSTNRGRTLKIIASNRLLASGTGAVIACAQAQIASLVAEGNPRELIAVVHNGVDPACFRPDPSAGARLRHDLGIPPTAFIVGMVAAHRQEKRHDRFINAIEKLAARGIDCYGLMAGGGPLLERSVRRVAESPAGARIVILGPRRDVVSIYSACDVCVLCSDGVETLPLVLLEAQACGTPVVAMDTGGIAEAFVDGTSGILVDQGDVVALAAVLESMALDPEKRHAMGQSGRVWVAIHRSTAAMVEGYERVLTRAATRHPIAQG